MKEIKRLSDIVSVSKKLTILIGSGVNTRSAGGKEPPSQLTKTNTK
jgi:hypothetical protein